MSFTKKLSSFSWEVLLIWGGVIAFLCVSGLVVNDVNGWVCPETGGDRRVESVTPDPTQRDDSSIERIQGPFLVKDINTHADPKNGWPKELTLMGDFFYFRAADETHGSELWKTDLTASGTSLVKDIGVDYVSGANQGSNPQYLTVINDTLYFSGEKSLYGYELWRSDGSTTGTFLFKDIGENDDYRDPIPGYRPKELISINGLLFFMEMTQ